MVVTTGGMVEMTPPLSFRESLATEESVILNPVPNEFEGACEESGWFQDDRKNGRMTVT
jgi:hypothetical protein